LSRQHRRWIVTLYVFGQYVRFIRIDRAGLIVTSAVNYVRDPRTLVEFFWRYNHLSPPERGFDSTYRIPCYGCRESFAIVDESKTRPYPNIGYTLSKDYPTYKVEVVDEDSGDKTWYIIRKPCFDMRSPFGRTTRGFIALRVDNRETIGPSALPSMLARKLVFLKDYWRHYTDGVPSEADIYQELAEAGVPHVASYIGGGDVFTEKHAQHSLTQKVFLVNGLRWVHLSKSLAMHVHHRLVQQLAFPIGTIRSAKELIQVLRDAMQALIDAYVKARILHHISNNNILVASSDSMEETGRGLLNDWDIARKLQEELFLRLPRAGTWRFMSVELLRRSDKPHSIHDDLESMFWVLAYISI
ncbi:hypothetical protein K474DRAFT_1564579, partial [Panus rudis PR-1116 ss-1]